MRQAKRAGIWAVGVAVCWWTGSLWAATSMNYQGRVTSGGSNFTGTGYFKFVLLDNGGQGLWSNDGSTGTNEPATSFNAPVNNGLFTLELGDGGMTAIPALTWHRDPVYLRTWFSASGVGGTFEELSPDLSIRPMGMDRLNTGNAIIVDDWNDGDMSDLQAAIDLVATSMQYNAVLVMPGYYSLSSPLRLPTNNTVRITGLGGLDDVVIDNPNGSAALLAGYAKIENIHFRGSPALVDTNVTSWADLEFENCSFRRDSGFPGGPVVQLQGLGECRMNRCRIDSDMDAIPLHLAGQVNVTVYDTIIERWGLPTPGPAVLVTNYNGWSLFSRCEARSETGDVMRVAAGGGWFSMKWVDSQFQGEIGIHQAGSGNLSLVDCTLGDYQLGRRALTKVDDQLWLRVQGCEIMANSNTAVYVRDSQGGFRVEGSRITAADAPAVDLIATPGGAFRDIRFETTTLWVDQWWGGAATAVRVDNSMGNSTDNSFVEFVRCLIRGTENGMAMTNIEVDVSWCDVEGDVVGIDIVECMLDVSWSTVEGMAFGIWADESDVSIDHSDISAGEEESASGTAVHFNSPSGRELFVFTSSLDGAGNGTGLWVNVSAESGMVIILNSVISAEGPALESLSGTIHAGSSTFFSEWDSAAVLWTLNTLPRFTQCTFLGMSGGNINPAIALGGTLAVPIPPTPSIYNSSILSLFPPFNAPASIGMHPASVPPLGMGSVLLVNSVIATNISPSVTVLPASAVGMINNNMLLP